MSESESHEIRPVIMPKTGASGYGKDFRPERVEEGVGSPKDFSVTVTASQPTSETSSETKSSNEQEMPAAVEAALIEAAKRDESSKTPTPSPSPSTSPGKSAQPAPPPPPPL